MKCARCQQSNPSRAKFCLECAAPLARTCGNCGRQLSPTAKLCPECAHPTSSVTAAQPRFSSADSDTAKHLAELVEQQTATAEILRVISGSPTDVQPVFDAIVRNAVRLCDALFCVAYRFDGTLIHPVAHHNMTPEALEALRRMWPAPPSRESITARSILERSVVHVADVTEEGVSAASITFGGTLGRELIVRNPIRPGRGSVAGRTALERRTVHIHDILADAEYDLPDLQRRGGYRTVLGSRCSGRAS